MFDEIDTWDTGSTTDPIEQYLSTPTWPNVKDPLKWYSAQLSGGSEASVAAARMALDFLSAPGKIFYLLCAHPLIHVYHYVATSVDVERAFSRGGLTVSKRRHALSDESTRASIVLGSWASVEGLVPTEKVLQVLREKGKRSKATKTANVYVDGDEDIEDVEIVAADSTPSNV